jgi:hypothetical protein
MDRIKCKCNYVDIIAHYKTLGWKIVIPISPTIIKVLITNLTHSKQYYCFVMIYNDVHGRAEKQIFHYSLFEDWHDGYFHKNN